MALLSTLSGGDPVGPSGLGTWLSAARASANLGLVWGYWEDASLSSRVLRSGDLRGVHTGPTEGGLGRLRFNFLPPHNLGPRNTRFSFHRDLGGGEAQGGLCRPQGSVLYQTDVVSPSLRPLRIYEDPRALSEVPVGLTQEGGLPAAREALPSVCHILQIFKFLCLWNSYFSGM